MNRYSRILHHISIKDLKRKRRDDILLGEKKKKELELIEIEKKQIDSLAEKEKSNWKDELTEVFGFECPSKSILEE